MSELYKELGYSSKAAFNRALDSMNPDNDFSGVFEEHKPLPRRSSYNYFNDCLEVHTERHAAVSKVDDFDVFE